jgi:hypothetical protein
MRGILEIVKVGLDTLDDMQEGHNPLEALHKAWSKSELSKLGPGERIIGFSPSAKAKEVTVESKESVWCHHGHVKKTCIYCKERTK